MRKYICLILSVLLVCGLCSCGGNVAYAKTRDVASDIYSQEDISSAINTIKMEFKTKWSGCTLTEIYYAGDEYSEDHQDWADRNNSDEVIVLLSSFDVGAFGGDGSLNPNSTYDNWMWILVRTSGGTWKHVDHGY